MTWLNISCHRFRYVVHEGVGNNQGIADTRFNQQAAVGDFDVPKCAPSKRVFSNDVLLACPPFSQSCIKVPKNELANVRRKAPVFLIQLGKEVKALIHWLAIMWSVCSDDTHDSSTNSKLYAAKPV